MGEAKARCFSWAHVGLVEGSRVECQPLGCKFAVISQLRAIEASNIRTVLVARSKEEAIDSHMILVLQ